MKTCNDCKIDKPYTEFHKKSSSRDGYQSRCKGCNIKRVTKWQAENAERYEETWRGRDANPDYVDRHNLRRRAAKYGLTVEELTARLDAAGGKCAICGRLPERGLVIDHCHNSLKVRGLLCGTCNQVLGLMKDNPAWLQSAIDYLTKA